MVVVHFYTNHIICAPEGQPKGYVFGIVPITYRHFDCVGESTVRHVLYGQVPNELTLYGPIFCTQHTYIDDIGHCTWSHNIIKYNII